MRLETDKRLTRNEVRVVELQTSHCEAQDELIKQVLSIPALTPEGEAEKFLFYSTLSCRRGGESKTRTLTTTSSRRATL